MGRYTVGQVAQLFGLTVRTLHHYDDLGLLRPSERSLSGYRLYTERDLERLQHIVVYRRLELPLEEISELLASGDATSHLRRQRERVTTRLDELHLLVAAIDNALEKTMNDQPVTTDDMRELFGDEFDDYQAEAEHRWGDTDTWQESQRRTASYTKEQWIELKAQGEAVEKAFADAFRAGLPASSKEAMDAAELHRLQVDRWFYDCPHEQHRGLGDLYVSDPAYVARYDQSFGLPGLAQFCRDAIHANADRHREG